MGRRLSELFPNQFTIPRVTTDPSSPLIYSGTLLHISDVNMLPVQKEEVTKTSKTGLKLYGAFGSYAVIKSLVDLPPENSYKFLWEPTHKLVVWIGSVSYEDDLDSLISTFNETGFGVARISSKQGRTLITLEDVVEKVRRGELDSELGMDSISSEPITVSKDTLLVDALQYMFKARVRRLFAEDDPKKFVSDRTILAFLFSPHMLEVAKESPSKWLDLRLDQLQENEATAVQADASLGEGAQLLGKWPDDCLLTDKNRVVTRWDIIIKPWKKNLLRVAASQKASPRLRKNTSTSRSGYAY